MGTSNLVINSLRLGCVFIYKRLINYKGFAYDLKLIMDVCRVAIYKCNEMYRESENNLYLLSSYLYLPPANSEKLKSI